MKYVLDGRVGGGRFPGIGRYGRNLAAALPAALLPDEQLEILTAGPSPFSPQQQWVIPRKLRGANVYHSPYYLLPWRPGVPTVLTIHDLIPLRFPQLVAPRARLLFGLTMRLALRAADRLITGSEAARRDYCAAFGLRADQIEVIPHGVEAHFRPQPPAEVARVRAKLRLPAALVLYLGINKPHKNLLNLVQAWAKAAPSLPGAELGIAGSWDPRYPQARAWVAAQQPPPPVRFLGPIDEADLPGLYAAAQIFVFPSRYEGFGLPVLEAMACGAPVICANRSSLPEVGGEAVVYFDPDDQAGLAAALVALLPDEARRADLQARGLARARAFTWERAAARTAAVYRALAGGRG